METAELTFGDVKQLEVVGSCPICGCAVYGHKRVYRDYVRITDSCEVFHTCTCRFSRDNADA